jgi:hypothetical protein
MKEASAGLRRWSDEIRATGSGATENRFGPGHYKVSPHSLVFRLVTQFRVQDWVAYHF